MGAAAAAARLALVAVALVAMASRSHAAEDGFVQGLADNAGFELESYADAFLRHPDSTRPDNTPVTSWTRLAVTSSGDVTDRLSLNISGYLLYSSPSGQQGMFNRPGEDSPVQGYGGVTALNLTYFGDKTSYTLGKADVAMGVAELYSPTDRFTTFNYYNPLHIRREGAWQGRLDYALGDDTASVVVLPFQDSSIFPADNSRWLNANSDYQFFDATAASGDRRRNPRLRNWAVLTKYQAVRNGYDFFVGTHVGPAGLPVVSFEKLVLFTQLETVKEQPWASSIFGGIVTTSDAWKLYAEALLQNTHGARDQDFMRYVLGVSYRETKLAPRLGLEEITPVLEYAGLWETNDAVAFPTLVGSAMARAHPNTILAKLKLKVDDDLAFSLGLTANLSDHDHSRLAGFEYAVNDNLMMIGQLSLLGGSNNTQFGRWTSNDAVSLGFNYRF